MDYSQEQVERLRNLITDEIILALGLDLTSWSRRIFTPIFRTPTYRFAELGARFDRWVSGSGFGSAARRILPQFVLGYEAMGLGRIPRTGPLIIASNHPGTYDSLIIAACLPRDDLRIISTQIPFLENLPAARDHLIFAPRDVHARMVVLRECIRHLRAGGALLLFPSGSMDPDPRVMSGAEGFLPKWSRSLDLLIRTVPDVQVVVTIISGVLARNCVRSPITWLRKGRLDRQRLAQFLQVIRQLLFAHRLALNPQVSFAEPLQFSTDWRPSDSGSRLAQIISRAQTLIEEHCGAMALA